jgi:hypothetical protein
VWSCLPIVLLKFYRSLLSWSTWYLFNPAPIWAFIFLDLNAKFSSLRQSSIRYFSFPFPYWRADCFFKRSTSSKAVGYSRRFFCSCPFKVGLFCLSIFLITLQMLSILFKASFKECLLKFSCPIVFIEAFCSTF